MKLQGVICRLSPFGTGAIFHQPTGKAFMFKKDRVTGDLSKISVGREVEFTLKKSRLPRNPKSADNIVPTDVLQGKISYLDPTDKNLTTLIGEIYTGYESYLFSFTKDDKLKKGMAVRFRVNEKGMAIVLKS